VTLWSCHRKELQRTTGVLYLAGLWDYEKLPSLLQWNVTIPAYALGPRLNPQRAPSWTWIGADGPVVIHYSEEIVERFQILASIVTGGFGTSARGSITVKGSSKAGTWWHTMEKLRIGDDCGVIGAVETWNNGLTIWPDCADELMHYVDGVLSTHCIELTFVAIGRVDWNRKLVRGLVLKLNESQNDYTRVGLLQCLDDGESTIDNWDVEIVVIV
jgi:hypothetical protein